MNRNTIRSTRHEGWPAHNTDMMLLVATAHLASGVHVKFQGGSKWPDDGLPPTTVQGVKVWVKPIVRVPGRKSSKHRVMCECPECGQVLSVGRLHQHVCKKVA